MSPIRISRATILHAAAASFVALCSILFLSGRSSASSIRISLGELSAGSPVVVRGRVDRLESAWTPQRTIETTVFVRSSVVSRGSVASGALLPIRICGGTINGLTMGCSDEAAFRIGEEVLVFLREPRDGAYRVAAGGQGKFIVRAGEAFNPPWGESFDLADLEAGVRSQRWPAAMAPSAEMSAAAQAAQPDGYGLSGQRWAGPNPMPENFVINVNTADANGGNGSRDAFINAIIEASRTWNNAGAAFRFQYGGTSGGSQSGEDGVNLIHWESSGFDQYILAQANWWYYSDGTIVEADIRFNDQYAWDATGAPSSNEYDLQSVATHELGHWLSLAHDNDTQCPNTSAVMCPSINPQSTKRALGANDVAGIKAIYGVAQAQPTNTPRPTVTPTPTRTPTTRPTFSPGQIKSRVRLPLILRTR